MKRQTFCTGFLLLALALLTGTPAFAAPPSVLPLLASTATNCPPATLPQELAFDGQREREWQLRAPGTGDWLNARAIQYQVQWPANAPDNAQSMVCLIDRDDRWYQAVVEAPLRPGNNLITIPLASGAAEWQPVGHAAAWHYRVRLNPRSVAVRIFRASPFTATCRLTSATLLPAEPPTRPVILRVRPGASRIPCYSLYEAALDLPDRYADPFDPAQIAVTALVTTPEGREVTIPGFYFQDFYRLRDPLQAGPQPQGRPEWRIRFCPRTPGRYRYTLRVVDPAGAAEWREGAFEATPAGGPGFVRVAAGDRRYFELDTGEPFYPIGHNIRSPYDSRMDDKFPWKLRQQEGTRAYERYFRDMARHQENLVEIWSCAWSLGLEWSPVIAGYHGYGDYNLANAWELDRVMEQARQHQLRVNLVLNNHGRVSSCNHLDPEWNDHPYNTSRGGWLTQAMQFFDDPRAQEMQRRLYRYYLARWGWDPSLFAWELFSEVNLTGHQGNLRTAHDARVVEWHRLIGAYFQTNDVNRHLVTTHISNDYTLQNPDLCQLPELDACAVDAYHFSHPGQIIALLQSTARFNNPFNKPVIVTEFGGSPMAAGAGHLARELHAALWTATATPLSGLPLFWWWQVVEERNFYPEYAAVARFLQGVDPRNPAMVAAGQSATLRDGESTNAPNLQVVCMASRTNTTGWIYTPSAFDANIPPVSEPDLCTQRFEHVQLVLTNLEQGVYRVRFFSTTTGAPVREQDGRLRDDLLTVDVPGFTRDIAFRAHRLNEP
jgi:hypothetical protein